MEQVGGFCWFVLIELGSRLGILSPCPGPCKFTLAGPGFAAVNAFNAKQQHQTGASTLHLKHTDKILIFRNLLVITLTRTFCLDDV